MSSKSNNYGRAYEYTCLHSLHLAISAIRPAEIIHNSSYDAARYAWDSLDPDKQTLLTLSANSTIETIFALEPNIVEQSEDILQLYIQKDERGEVADVRDIIIERTDIRWEIGLSIKHNHMAVKHSRLAKELDFGKKWYGKACSKQYWDDIKPVFSYLEKEKANNTYFRNLASKEDTIYLPILNAFIKELKNSISKDSSIPRKLIEYLLSKYDFYKVISLDNKHITTIQSFNMYGTLNKASRVKKPELLVPVIKLPKEILYIGLKKRSKTTVLLCFDNGWQFSFRIHNAEKLVNTSLKFDIQIVGMPADVNIKYDCKW